MTPSFLKRLAASGTAAIVLTSMLLLGSGLTAQASEEVGPHNGLEGTWRVQLSVRDCQTDEVLRTFPSLFAFADGGTLTVTTPGQFPALSTPPLGVWHHVKGHNYSAVTEAFVFSPTGAWIQTHRLTRAIRVHGDEF